MSHLADGRGHPALTSLDAQSTLDEALSALLGSKLGGDMAGLGGLTLSPAGSGGWATPQLLADPPEELLDEGGDRFRRRHTMARERPVVCQINNCGRRFSSDNSLRNHIRRKHSSRAILSRASEYAKRHPQGLGAAPPQAVRPRHAGLGGPLSPLSPSTASPYGSSTSLSPVPTGLGLPGPLSRSTSVDLGRPADLTLSPLLARRHSLYDSRDAYLAGHPAQAVEDLKEWLAARICEVTNQLAHNQQRRSLAPQAPAWQEPPSTSALLLELTGGRGAGLGLDGGNLDLGALSLQQGGWGGTGAGAYMGETAFDTQAIDALCSDLQQAIDMDFQALT